MTIWSIDTPSSRDWMRSVCGPGVAKKIGAASDPYELSVHPHPETPAPDLSSRITDAAVVDPMR
jgi:hypothetical protein